jgi:hypothetical protein
LTDDGAEAVISLETLRVDKTLTLYLDHPDQVRRAAIMSIKSSAAILLFFELRVCVCCDSCVTPLSFANAIAHRQNAKRSRYYTEKAVKIYN